MLIGIDSSEVIRRFGEEKGLELIKQAGFDCVDFTFVDPPRLDDTYLEQAKQTKALLDKIGLICNQAHAPFRSFKYGQAMDCSNPHFLEIVRSLEYASIIGAKHIVVHGVRVPSAFGNDISNPAYRLYSCFGTEESLAYNYDFFKSLAPYAKKFGIQIAIENVGVAFAAPYLMNEIIKRLDDPVFVVLVDIGHSFLFRTAPEVFISSVTPGMIKGLHVQDNDGITDQHLLPGLGQINWDNVLCALVDYGYDGDFTLEIPYLVSQMPVEATFETLALAAKISRTFVSRMDDIRKSRNA